MFNRIISSITTFSVVSLVGLLSYVLSNFAVAKVANVTIITLTLHGLLPVLVSVICMGLLLAYLLGIFSNNAK